MSESRLQGSCKSCCKPTRKRNVFCRECYLAHQNARTAPSRPCGNTDCKNAVRSPYSYCSPECRLKAKPKPQPRLCRQCNGPCVKGRTCSDTCYSVYLQARSRIGVRTDAQRTVRRQQKKTRYKRPDKQAKIAELMVLQQGKCAVCDLEKELFLDHNHETGEARLLLCRNCNIAFGQMKEDPDLISVLLAYAETCKAT